MFLTSTEKRNIYILQYIIHDFFFQGSKHLLVSRENFNIVYSMYCIFFVCVCVDGVTFFDIFWVWSFQASWVSCRIFLNIASSCVTLCSNSLRKPEKWYISKLYGDCQFLASIALDLVYLFIYM